MKKGLIFLLFFFLVLSTSAQLVNGGGTITIEPGASIYSTGSFTNLTGIVTNDGKIEVQRNFINTGMYSSTANEDSLIMSGSGNALLRSENTPISFLTINKATDTDLVTLSGSAVVNQKLDYLSGVLSTDYTTNPPYVLSAPVSAIFNFANGHEIIGNVKRTGWVNGSPVVFNSSQLQITTNGGISPTDITIAMVPQAFGGDPSQAEREVKRRFLFAQTGGFGFTADVRLPYTATELNTNAESNLVPWSLVNNEWNARLTPVVRDTANKWVATTGIAAAAFSGEWKLADPRYTFNVTANLRGAWNGTAMSANINSILPTVQPYNVDPFNYFGTEAVPAIPNTNIVDWVLLELRKPGSGLAQDATISTVIGRKTGFLLSNGTIVDLDGITPIAFDIAKQGPSFIAVRHRNHLGVLSNAVPSNALGTFTNDFSVLGNAYRPLGAASDPLVLLSGGTKYGLWAGDANKNGVVNVTDVNVIKLAIAASLGGYLLTDVNLSNSINVTDVNVTKTTISASGGGSISLRIKPSGKVRTNLPDPVIE